MSEAGGNAEPSMDEILASIRKIISEDDEVKPEAAAAEEEPLVLEEDTTEEINLSDEAEDEIELVDEVDEDQALALNEEVEEVDAKVDLHEEPEEVEAAPAPPPPPPPPPPASEPVSALVGDEPRQKAAMSLTNLSTAIAEHRPGLTVEQLAEDLLRPMLREWLDANLPDMVERLVQKEIQRMADQAEPR